MSESYATNLRALALAIQADIPILLVGEPGTGKSSAAAAIAADLGMHYECVIGSIREPTDFSGWPVPNKVGGLSLVPAPWVQRTIAAGKTLVNLDELSTAPPAVQAAMLRIVLERVAGDTPLPSECRVMATMNPPETAANGQDICPPLANRFCWLPWKLDAATWASGAVSGFTLPPVPTLPPTWQTHLPLAQATVAGFVRARPSLLHAMPQDIASQSGAWPSPRTWSMTASLLAACEATGEGPDVKLALVAGCVGPGAALELLTWLTDENLPKAKDILAHPTTTPIPERADRCWTVAASLAEAASKKPLPAWAAAIEYLTRMADLHGADLVLDATSKLCTTGLPLTGIDKIPDLAKRLGNLLMVVQ